MGYNMDALANKKARRASTGWTAKEGSNLVRILPHTSLYFTEPNSPMLNDFAYEWRSHWCKSEGRDTTVYRCRRDQQGGVCNFCKAVAEFKDSQVPELQEAAKELRASERHGMNIVETLKPESGVQVFECGPQVYTAILDYAGNPAWGDLFSITEGRNVDINLTPGNKSKSGYNEYKASPVPQQTDFTPHLVEGWMDTLDNLKSILPPYADEKQEQEWLTAMGLVAGTPAPVAPAPAPVPAAPVPTPQPVPVAPVPTPQPVPVAPVPTPQPVPVAPVPTPQPVPAAPAPVPAAPAPVAVPVVNPTPPVADSSDPVVAFVLQHGLEMKAVGTKSQPQCFGEGPGNAQMGYNKYPNAPCAQNCPVKSECQLATLGL